MRPTFWLPTTFVFCIMSLLIFIIAVSIPLGLPPEEPVAEEPVEVEEQIAEEPEEEPAAEEPVEEPAEEDQIAEEPEEAIKDWLNQLIETINSWLKPLGLEIPLPNQ
ncbi:MAG: hypothetical protein U5N58_13950 [Actinomycetota bacterium]|nr:hypothetical protein [Actinomycetota bacterium]